MRRNHLTIAVVAAVVLLAGLTGCSTPDDDTATPTTAPTRAVTSAPTTQAAPEPTDGMIQGVPADLYTQASEMFAEAGAGSDGTAVIGAVATSQRLFKDAGAQAFALFSIGGNYRVGVLYLEDEAGKKAFFDGADIKADGHPTKEAAIAELQPLLDAHPDVPLLDFTS